MTIKAYLIGGPMDLSIIALKGPEPVYRVALMDPIPTVHKGPLTGIESYPRTVEPRIGRYRKVGELPFSRGCYVYDYEGEEDA